LPIACFVLSHRDDGWHQNIGRQRQRRTNQPPEHREHAPGPADPACKHFTTIDMACRTREPFGKARAHCRGQPRPAIVAQQAPETQIAEWLRVNVSTPTGRKRDDIVSVRRAHCLHPFI
jgi:hypothetical protein